MMEFLEALEAYLFETGQVRALAKRQTRVLCRSVADERLHDEARALLLLNCAALERGAPRAPRDFLLRPLEKNTVRRHIKAFENEHPGTMPVWEKAIADPASTEKIASMLDKAINNPLRLAPLTGEEPRGKDGRFPLLVAGRTRRDVCMGFSRYWRAAAALEKEICRRLQRQSAAVPDIAAAEALKQVFTVDSILEKNGTCHFRQVAAAALALRTPFMIVSGGPGTGKTSVVTQILRTLLRALRDITPDRIVLCAPTGRAKARLGESIDQGIDFLEKKAGTAEDHERELDLGLKNLQRNTLHGLLGTRPDGSMKFNAENPLPYQVIVVDEASMVDVCLFSALMEAAPQECRILLVGDMHQLPPVEAGAVLGDLTGRFDGSGYPTLTKETADWLRKVIKGVATDEGPLNDAFSCVLSTPAQTASAGPLADHTVILTRSYRSAEEILKISEYVNRGRIDLALKSITGNKDAGAVKLDTRQGQKPIGEWLEACYTKETLDAVLALRDLDIDAAADPARQEHGTAVSGLDKAFEVFYTSRVLTLTNVGTRGRIAINALAEKLLRPQLSGRTRGRFFHGQQVILGQNLHSLDLYNGDRGMVVQTKEGSLKVVFRRGKKYSIHVLERLTGLEPAFAMTVHKAQGSEFGAVLLVLPEYESPLLTRQVLYTGLTRARDRLCILGTEEMLRLAIEAREERPGGVSLNCG
jgi:exodeoxyribonuclease V alpha subunit